MTTTRTPLKRHMTPLQTTLKIPCKTTRILPVTQSKRIPKIPHKKLVLRHQNTKVPPTGAQTTIQYRLPTLPKSALLLSSSQQLLIASASLALHILVFLLPSPPPLPPLALTLIYNKTPILDSFITLYSTPSNLPP